MLKNCLFKSEKVNIEGEFIFYDSINDLPKNWNDISEGKDIFLSKDYLFALETSLPKGMKLIYIAYYNQGDFIGVGLVQLLKIKLAESLKRNLREDPTTKDKLKSFFKNEVSKLINLNCLVAGNLLLTGEHSYCFKEGLDINPIDLWMESIEALPNYYKEVIEKVNLNILKDFRINEGSNGFVKNKDLIAFKVQPNMRLSIRSHWVDMDCYVGDMKKKYRQRYRVAIKKSKDIEQKEFDLAAIKSYQEELNSLYLSVSDKAEFNTFILHPDYFYNLKLSLKSNFRLMAQFLNDKLVGFYTLIINNEELEPHFLGYCSSLNRKYQLYLSMLFQIVEFAILAKKQSVEFGRTALEIKSTVGAEPEEMIAFIRNENKYLNKISRITLKFLNPQLNWVQRSPFKLEG